MEVSHALPAGRATHWTSSTDPVPTLLAVRSLVATRSRVMPPASLLGLQDGICRQIQLLAEMWRPWSLSGESCPPLAAHVMLAAARERLAGGAASAYGSTSLKSDARSGIGRRSSPAARVRPFESGRRSSPAAVRVRPLESGRSSPAARETTARLASRPRHEGCRSLA